MNKKKYYVLLAILTFAIIVIAFAGFKAWTQIILPNIFDIKNFPPSMFYSFALLAGLISFIAPCAIGVLPAYAAYYLELKEADSEESKFKHAIKMGAVAASGIFALYVVLGIILTILGTSVASFFTISKPIIAGFLLIIGLALFVGYGPKTNYVYNLINKRFIKGRAKNSLFFFGILYGAAALGCALLVFVPLVIIPFTTGKFLTGLISFILYSLTFGVAMIITTVLVAYSKNIIVEKITTSSNVIKKVTGAILILSAIYLLYYFVRFGM